MLKGLESYVDDNGVGKDDLALVVADVFPRDLSRNPTGTLQRVSEAISTLRSAGLLWRYVDNGTALLYVAFWESVQRIEKPTRGRFPRPDGTMNYRDSLIRESLPEDSGNPPGTLRPGTGEQGNRGTGEQSLSSEIAEAITRPEIIQLLDLLDSEIERNGAKKPARTKKNIDATRLLLDRDGRTVEQVAAAIRWCQSDEFWRSNILSMSKLREKYETLRLAAQRAKPGADVAPMKPKRKFVAGVYDDEDVA